MDHSQYGVQCYELFDQYLLGANRSTKRLDGVSEVMSFCSSHQQSEHRPRSRRFNRRDALTVDPPMARDGQRKDEEGRILPKILFYKPDKIFCSPADRRYGDWTLARRPLLARDVVQGQEGDCWLIAAIASIVHTRPHLMDSILAFSGVNTDGAFYRIKLYRDGREVLIEIDDRLPCQRQPTDHTVRKLVFASCKRMQLFGAIVEKAVAAMFGCYELLTSYYSSFGFSMLSGYSSWYFYVNPNDLDATWNLMFSFHERHFPMVVNTFSDSLYDDKYPPDRVGLHSSHCYSLLDMRTLEMSNGVTTKLVQLMNTHDEHSWTGSWSDQCPNWSLVNENVRKELEPVKTADGIFWFPLSEFSNYFSHIDYCLAHDNDDQWENWRFESVLPRSGADSSNMVVFFLTVEEDTKIEITMHTRSRMSGNDHPKPMIPIGFAVFRLSDCGLKLAGSLIAFSGYDNLPLVYSEFVATKGIYYFVQYGFGHWADPTTEISGTKARLHRTVISIYANPHKVSVHKHSARTSLLGDSLYLLLRTETADYKTESKCIDGRTGEQRMVWCWCRWDKSSGYVYAVENRSTTKWATIAFDGRQSFCMSSTRGSLRSTDVIPPGHWQIIHLLTPLDASKAYHASYKVNCRASAGPERHEPDLGRAESMNAPRPLAKYNI